MPPTCPEQVFGFLSNAPQPQQLSEIPHFHAKYGSHEVLVSINDIEILEGTLPPKQQKMLLGWAAFHQEELKENWELAADQQELFAIEPLR